MTIGIVGDGRVCPAGETRVAPTMLHKTMWNCTIIVGEGFHPLPHMKDIGEYYGLQKYKRQNF